MISCNQYDYIEIACLYHIPVRLVMESGQIVEGKAKTTSYDEHRRECIVIVSSTGDRHVPTESLVSMTALIENPHFTEVIFTQVS
ncbi:Rho-binding antiterminator [Vibrio sp. Isolate25]|uniref:Rho-binding antiterminator n=1 Tax=unclassified Vibrio TaxID=2614977 RepID=UPI001EFD69C7|nr:MULTISPECIES: Rho-binding antiterminator [unclassified Vibrio]MCG9595465.1 Rho-binding antiterminator [Vibrio sp. Isolate25]MCG9676957.1 Rho-binding antiterminator [Vibrio sp. Isolate24]